MRILASTSRCNIHGDWIFFILAKLHAYKTSYENSQMPMGFLLWMWMTYGFCVMETVQ